MPSHPAAARTDQARTTRDLILDAAERRFADRGFAGVSMRELAADAGLRNQASLYNHFKNKRALYEAVLARGVGPIVAAISPGPGSPEARREAGASPEEFVDLVFDYLVEHPHLPRLIQRASLDDSRYLRNALMRLLRPLYERGLGLLAARGGRWQPADLPHLAAGLYQLIFGYFASARLLEMVIGDDPLRPQAIARQRRFLKAAVTQLIQRGAPR